MKRLLSITAVLFAAAPAFADVLSFTDAGFPTSSNCTGVTGTETATLTLPNQSPVTLTVKGREVRQQKLVSFLPATDGYCATVLTSDAPGFDKALAAKDDTGATIRDAVSGTNGTGGMLFAIRMDIKLPDAPVDKVQSSYEDALKKNTQQSLTAFTAEPATGPLHSFINLSLQAGGATLNQNLLVTVDGRQLGTDGKPNPNFGQVYYQNANGQLMPPVKGPDAAFVQNMVAIWYGDTTFNQIDPMHKAFELKLLGLSN